MLDPGEVLGQLGDLGAVAEDGHGSFDLPLPPQGDAVGEDGDVGDGLQADVVLRLARLHHPGDGGVGIDVFEQLPQGADQPDRRFQCGLLEVVTC